MSRIHVKNMSDDIEEWRCICSGRRPQNGHALVLCKLCNIWQHQICVVGETIKPGFVCGPCEKQRRSDAGKKSSVTRRLRTEAALPPHTQPKRKFVEQGEPRDGRHANSDETGLFMSTSGWPGSPAFKHDVDAESYDTPSQSSSSIFRESCKRAKLSFNNIAELSTNIGSALRHQQATDRHGAGGSHLMVQVSPKPPVSEAKLLTQRLRNPDELESLQCRCIEKRRGSHKDYIICGICKIMTHKVCTLTSVSNELGLPWTIICDSCKRAIVRNRIMQYEESMQQIDYNKTTRRTFVENILWRAYCILPNSETPACVAAATRTYFDNGKHAPIYEAPKRWTNEVDQRISLMLAYTAQNKQIEILGPTPVKYDLQYTNSLRQLAMWLTYHGAYKNKPEKLGLLGEVFCLATKGRYWYTWRDYET